MDVFVEEAPSTRAAATHLQGVAHLEADPNNADPVSADLSAHLDRNHASVRACRRVLGDVRGKVVGPKPMVVRETRDSGSAEVGRLPAGTVVFVLELDESRAPDRYLGLVMAHAPGQPGGEQAQQQPPPQQQPQQAAAAVAAEADSAASNPLPMIEGWATLIAEGGKVMLLDSKSRLDAGLRAETVKHWERHLRTDRLEVGKELLQDSGAAGGGLGGCVDPQWGEAAEGAAGLAGAALGHLEHDSGGGREHTEGMDGAVEEGGRVLAAASSANPKDGAEKGSGGRAGDTKVTARGEAATARGEAAPATRLPIGRSRRAPVAGGTGGAGGAAASTASAPLDDPPDKKSPFMEELRLTSEPHGFAFGGAYPGVLHAKGALHEYHKVSYMVSVAGSYLLHVRLRMPKEATPLPGSPFLLTVSPGEPYARSTVLSNPGRSETGEWWVSRIHAKDKTGNTIIKGGCRIECVRGADSEELQKEVVDNKDGVGERERARHRPHPTHPRTRAHAHTSTDTRAHTHCMTM